MEVKCFGALHVLKVFVYLFYFIFYLCYNCIIFEDNFNDSINAFILCYCQYLISIIVFANQCLHVFVFRLIRRSIEAYDKKK